MNILIVDDTEDLAQLLQSYLSEMGHSVTAVYDGQAGWEHIASGRFELAFLDMEMPERNGLELLRQIQDQKISIKTVVMTGYPTEIEDLVREVGADDYVSKPFNLVDIEKIIQKFTSPTN